MNINELMREQIEGKPSIDHERLKELEQEKLKRIAAYQQIAAFPIMQEFLLTLRTQHAALVDCAYAHARLNETELRAIMSEASTLNTVITMFNNGGQYNAR